MKADIALFFCWWNTSPLGLPKFAAAGTTVIDNSSAWRMDPLEIGCSRNQCFIINKDKSIAKSKLLDYSDGLTHCWRLA